MTFCLNVIRKKRGKTVRDLLESIGERNGRILNIGSASTTYGRNCINLDIVVQEEVNIIGDAHELPFASETFDVCILSAVLQYCRDPFRVAREILRVLVPGGKAIIDAPFIQPWCGPSDLYRFSKEGLEKIFKDLDVISCEPSIGAGPAMAFHAQSAVMMLIKNRYWRFLATNFVSLMLIPVSLLKWDRDTEVAGACILLAEKHR